MSERNLEIGCRTLCHRDTKRWGATAIVTEKLNNLVQQVIATKKQIDRVQQKMSQRIQEIHGVNSKCHV